MFFQLSFLSNRKPLPAREDFCQVYQRGHSVWGLVADEWLRTVNTSMIDRVDVVWFKLTFIGSKSKLIRSMVRVYVILVAKQLKMFYNAKTQIVWDEVQNKTLPYPEIQNGLSHHHFRLSKRQTFVYVRLFWYKITENIHVAPSCPHCITVLIDGCSCYSYGP